jgi:uncharacterized protein YaaN involved in tellurite resistance
VASRRGKTMAMPEPAKANLLDEASEGSALEGAAQPAPAGELSESGNIDKIREILFGTQSREFEKRFLRLEERLAKESNELRDEIRRRFETIESYTRKETELLGEQLRREQTERGENLGGLSQELSNLGRALEKKIAHVDELMTGSCRELRQQILDQAKSSAEEIRQKVETLSAVLDRQFRELHQEKTDRSALAEMFAELSLRLRNEFKLPPAE